MMKWTTEAKVGAFSLAGIILFTIIIVHLSTLVIFGRSGFLVTGYFKGALAGSFFCFIKQKAANRSLQL